MEKIFEIFDDCLVNWYFSNEKEFEKPFQKSLSKAQSRLNIEDLDESSKIKALHITEDIFYIYVYTLFKKKEIEILQSYIKYNSYDKDFINLYQLRKELDNKLLDYLNSKIDFLKL